MMDTNKENVIEILKKNKYSFTEEENQIKVKLAPRFFLVICFQHEQQNGCYTIPKYSFRRECLVIIFSIIMFSFLVFTHSNFKPPFSVPPGMSVLALLVLFWIFRLFYYQRRISVIKKKLQII